LAIVSVVPVCASVSGPLSAVMLLNSTVPSGARRVKPRRSEGLSCSSKKIRVPARALNVSVLLARHDDGAGNHLVEGDRYGHGIGHREDLELVRSGGGDVELVAHDHCVGAADGQHERVAVGLAVGEQDGAVRLEKREALELENRAGVQLHVEEQPLPGGAIEQVVILLARDVQGTADLLVDRDEDRAGAGTFQRRNEYAPVASTLNWLSTTTV
jgi:hypothetical protein